MFCENCGKEIPDDSEFCGFCGAGTAAAAAPQGPPPPPPLPPPSQPPPPPPAGGAVPPMGTGVPPVQYGAQPPKKSAMPWVMGVLGVLVVGGIILVLLLGFAVGPKWFVGDDDGGNGQAAGSPEQTVEDFFKSLEKQDTRMLLGTMPPEFVDGIKEALGDDYLDLMDEYFFAYFPEDLKIDIEKMDSSVDGDTAEVTIKEGTMSYTDDYGDEVTQDAAEADMGTFELVKINGRWYLSEDTLIDIGFDFSDLESDGTTDGDTTDGDTSSLVELPVDSEDEVFTLLMEDPTLWDWYMETDMPDFEIVDQGTEYFVRLFELDAEGNEIPFATYVVDKETGVLIEAAG